MKNLTLFSMVCIAAYSMFLIGCDDAVIESNCANTVSVFTIDLDPSNCPVDIETALGTSSKYNESINGTTRTIMINGIANHHVGSFPNAGNPNTISVANETYEMTTQPVAATSITYGQGYSSGILFSGVALDVFTAEFFQGSGGVNRDWNITTLQTTRDLGLDCNNAHVQPTGRYHYHGTPSNYIESLGTADGTQMVKIGYAADGFPIYYKYGYADDGVTIKAFSSGYRLKTEERGGDGITAPNGCPDGYYFNDYEYVSGVSELDACNGRTGKTPESASEYYYVITDNFPSAPICFTGKPDQSFKLM
ncbi:MAG: YHYH protein [Chitinophagales bacterium]